MKVKRIVNVDTNVWCTLYIMQRYLVSAKGITFYVLNGMDAGMLVVWLRGVNFGFWSCLGCSGQNVIILAVKVSLRVVREEITKQKEF